MPDIMTKEKRSALMSRIRGTNTGTELAVFRELRRRGVGFARHGSDLPGRPDVVFRRCRVAVFVDGDFWHGWRFPTWEHKLQPKWHKKIADNRRRDQRNFRRLRRLGWRVLRVWEHEIETDLQGTVDRILRLRKEAGRGRSG